MGAWSRSPSRSSPRARRLSSLPSSATATRRRCGPWSRPRRGAKPAKGPAGPCGRKQRHRPHGCAPAVTQGTAGISCGDGQQSTGRQAGEERCQGSGGTARRIRWRADAAGGGQCEARGRRTAGKRDARSPGSGMMAAPVWTFANRWPALRAVDGATIVRLAAEASAHDVVGADELSTGASREAWHDFADLMRDVADSAAELDDADRAVLARQVDRAIADLEATGARVIAGAGSGVLHIAVLPQRCRAGARWPPGAPAHLRRGRPWPSAPTRWKLAPPDGGQTP